MTTTANYQVWHDGTSDADEPHWILSREEDECSDTLSVHDTLEDALAAAKQRGLDLMECHDCGIYVQPQEDRVGCGCHCPNCDATL